MPAAPIQRAVLREMQGGEVLVIVFSMLADEVQYIQYNSGGA